MEHLLSRLEQARLENPTGSDRDHVRRIAADVIRALDLTEPPVDVEMVASFLGIRTVAVDPRLPVSGWLRPGDDGSFEIRVCGTDPPRRRRFTICHECSHTFMPGFAVQPQYRCLTGTYPADDKDATEALCDTAASELLLPTQLFAACAGEAPFGFEAVEALADLFEASLEAVSHRMIEAWPEPAVLLRFTVRDGPTGRASTPVPLRLDYAYVQGRWPRFQPHAPATMGDVFFRALEGHQMSRTIITGVCNQPVAAEVHARPCPVTIAGVPVQRVLAIARQVGS